MIDLVHHLSRRRHKQDEAKSCRTEDDLLIIVTKQGKESRFDTKTLLLQLARLDASVAVPALVDLLTAYDTTGLQIGRLLWKSFCSSSSSLALFRYHAHKQHFYAYSAKPLALKRGSTKWIAVVKRSDGSILTKLQPSRRVQQTLLEALRRMTGLHAQEN